MLCVSTDSNLISLNVVFKVILNKLSLPTIVKKSSFTNLDFEAKIVEVAKEDNIGGGKRK